MHTHTRTHARSFTKVRFGGICMLRCTHLSHEQVLFRLKTLSYSFPNFCPNKLFNSRPYFQTFRASSLVCGVATRYSLKILLKQILF